MQLTRSFKMSEFESSVTAKSKGIDNTVKDVLVSLSLENLCIKLLQPLRDAVNYPITISSGYRTKTLNTLVGGSSTSQHMKGEASDIKISGFTSYQIASKVLSLKLPFDQMILYPTFCHLSLKKNGSQRSQILYHSTYSGKRL